MKCLCLILIIVGSHQLSAQTFREQYDVFRKSTHQEYDVFRDKANQEYVNFIRRAWKQYQALPEIPKPKDEPPLPPVIYAGEDEKNRDEPYLYEGVVPVVKPAPQPIPIVPIREMPEPITDYFVYSFFNTQCQVRLGEKYRFKLEGCDVNSLADVWQQLSGETYNNVVRDCLELRIRLHLCDWAYLMMLKELSFSFMGKGTNEAVMMLAYLYCQSGYKMRLAEAKGHLYLLFGSKHLIYDRNYWTIEGENYYPLDCEEVSLNICQASFPNEQSLSLTIPEIPLFSLAVTPLRTLQSEIFPTVKVTVSSNKNLLDFMSTYPSSMLDDDFGTRWAFYANTPLSKQIKEKLYPVLQNAIKEKSQEYAANVLINFVQTAFVYEYDDKVWGEDRAFFADETLYYPYCDCEDRAILFTRLIRDLLGLKTALIYYPGHLASAVCFTENVAGDYLLLEDNRYLICDPTYINAPVGKTMPDMDNKKAKVILLD